MLEKAGIILWSVSLWSHPIVIVQKKDQPEELPQKCLYVHYCTLSSLLSPVVKADSKAQGVLSLVHLQKNNKLYTMADRSTIYSSLDCCSGYHDIGLSSKTQNKPGFETLIGKFEFRKVPFGLHQASTHPKQPIDEVLNGLPFAFRYLDDIHISSKQHWKTLRTPMDYIW